jgi:uncharacterized protein (UPF0276 family)
VPTVLPSASARPLVGHGVGLRLAHYAHVLEHAPDVDFVEVITENFLGPGGRPRAVLRRVREAVPVVLHGVSLGVGSVDPPDPEYLRRVRELADEIEPAWISDHLSFGRIDGHHAHELLPLPCTEEALEVVVRNVGAVQEALGRRILLENVSSYVTFHASTMAESTFLAEVAKRADCLILLDVNNVIVSGINHGFHPHAYLGELPGDRVWQLHLANHTDRGRFRFDDHRGPVPSEVWALFEEVLRRFGEVSSIVEWDEDVPTWPELVAEQREAKRRAAAVLGTHAEDRHGPA